MKELIQKLKDGDHITDKELDELIAHYKSLVELLDVHGEIYKLVWLDCYYYFRQLQGYKASRQNKI